MADNIEQILKQCVNWVDSANIVIADGESPKDKYLIQLLKQANCIVCCDGAINTLEQHNIIPNYIIGDCDSLSLVQKQKYAAILKYLADQSSNDLTKAITFIINELHLENVIILGATGLREDHSLGNISLLVQYAQSIKNIILLSDYGFFQVYTGKATINTVPGQQISIFAIHNDTKVTTHGLRWDLNDLVLDSWYKGTLNQAQSTAFTIDSTKSVLVYQA